MWAGVGRGRDSNSPVHRSNRWVTRAGVGSVAQRWVLRCGKECKEVLSHYTAELQSVGVPYFPSFCSCCSLILLLLLHLFTFLVDAVPLPFYVCCSFPLGCCALSPWPYIVALLAPSTVFLIFSCFYLTPSPYLSLSVVLVFSFTLLCSPPSPWP